MKQARSIRSGPDQDPNSQQIHSGSASPPLPTHSRSRQNEGEEEKACGLPGQRAPARLPPPVLVRLVGAAVRLARELRLDVGALLLPVPRPRRLVVHPLALPDVAPRRRRAHREGQPRRSLAYAMVPGEERAADLAAASAVAGRRAVEEGLAQRGREVLEVEHGDEGDEGQGESVGRQEGAPAPPVAGVLRLHRPHLAPLPPRPAPPFSNLSSYPRARSSLAAPPARIARLTGK